MPSLTISKSRFVSGCQCPKKLFFDMYRKDLKPAIDDAQQALFDAGHEIGHLAQTRFPGGVDVSPENYYDFSASIAQTISLINQGAKTIYEAAFSTDGILAALDILHHEGNERWAIEVKSSKEVKDYHITDASLQYWVMNKSGFAPDKFFLMHIDNTYPLGDQLDVNRFFNLADITDAVLAKQSWVNEKINELKNVITSPNEPVLDIGSHCSKPFGCDYMHHCWKHIPENSVFNLSYARGKEWTLYKNGILEMSSIPDEFKLTHRQKMQVDGVKNGTDYIDTKSIENFISGWKFPLYFFDFETIFPSIPALKGTRAFQQVPFQYSLHIVNNETDDISHREFLAETEDFNNHESTDPRLQLIQQLKNDIGPTGSIVSYNAEFEIGVMRAMALDFPEEARYLEGLIERFVDLLVIFRNAWYYKPAMGGSASIKSVLPAVAPEFSYADLTINNGGDASNIYLAMIKNKFNGDVALTRKHLLKYCERDTFGMVILYNELVKVIIKK
jgi:hypothetical protein